MKRCRGKGFTLLELNAVIALIASLIAIGLWYYADLKNEAEKSSIETLANRFSSALTLVQVLQQTHRDVMPKAMVGTAHVNFAGQDVFFNEFGWPANTYAGFDSSTATQTSAECFQLWQLLLRNPPPALVEGLASEAPGRKRYVISVVPGSGRCRYQLLPANYRFGPVPRSESYFEYDPLTGKVFTLLLP